MVMLKKYIVFTTAVVVASWFAAMDVYAVGGGNSARMGSVSSTADKAISGALANVRSRYRSKLDQYGLTESYFDETGGICDLMLLDVTN